MEEDQRKKGNCKKGNNEIIINQTHYLNTPPDQKNDKS